MPVASSNLRRENRLTAISRDAFRNSGVSSFHCVPLNQERCGDE